MATTLQESILKNIASLPNATLSASAISSMVSVPVTDPQLNEALSGMVGEGLLTVSAQGYTLTPAGTTAAASTVQFPVLPATFIPPTDPALLTINTNSLAALIAQLQNKGAGDTLPAFLTGVRGVAGTSETYAMAIAVLTVVAAYFDGFDDASAVDLKSASAVLVRMRTTLGL